MMIDATSAARALFGCLPDGTAVESVALRNSNGMGLQVITYGASVQALHAPDRDGHSADIALGHATLTPYVERPNYFGITVGRYANRIAGARFTLDGETYALSQSNGPNTLHGGQRGFDKAVWRIEDVQSGPAASVTLSHLSPDGDQGFPGTLQVRVTYTLHAHNEITIAYAATTDKPTVVNLTNHTFFNLGGAGCTRNVMDHRLTIAADAYTPVNAALIPTGEIRPVAGTPFDFRKAVAIGARVRDAHDEQIRFGAGYDHNWVLRGGRVAEPRQAARLEDPASGRVLELLTTEPGLQFYSGNFLDATHIGKGDVLYRQGDGLCLEPQHFPDAPNQPAFPSARLDPGQTYRHISSFRFSTCPR